MDRFFWHKIYSHCRKDCKEFGTGVELVSLWLGF